MKTNQADPLSIHEKREIFRQEIFYGSDESKSTIGSEILRLYDQLPEPFSQEFNEVLWLVEQAQLYQQQPSSMSLTDINQTLHNRKLISKRYITSFITSNITLSTYNALKFDHYKALSLVVITQLYIHGDHHPQILKLCNEIRQYAQGGRKKLVPQLPDLNNHNFPSLIQSLDKAIQDHDGIDKQQHHRLSYYRNPIRASYEDRPGIHRTVSTREFKQGRELSKSVPIPFDDSNEEFTAKIIEVSTQSKIKDNWHTEDNAQPDRSLSLISSKRFINRNRHINAMQARAINNTIVKNSMSLTCNINHILEFDIYCVLHECIEICKKDTEDAQVATALLLILFTGNSLSEVQQWKSSRSEASRHIIGVQRHLKLPSVKKLDKELQFLTKDLQLEYTLPLPLNLVSPLRSFTFKSIKHEDVKRLLSDIKSKHHLSLTLSSISQYMKQTLTKDGVDICLIELINGHTPHNEPARFYTSIKHNDLIDAYTTYSDHLVTLSQSDYLRDHHCVKKTGYIGSPFFIDEARLQWLFSQFTDYFRSIPSKSSSYYSEIYHNMLTIELQMILGLATGYRPVNDWFGTMKDIHLATGEYRIADKERNSEYSGRVVILPKVAIYKLKSYLKYCEYAQLHYSTANPTLSQRYHDAIHGSMAFCFYIDKGKIDATTPSSYSLHVDSILPFQPNWTRHYLRSYLHSQNIPDEICAAWLGHLHANQLPFSLFSQLNKKELIKISCLLQEHLSLLVGGEYE